MEKDPDLRAKAGDNIMKKVNGIIEKNDIQALIGGGSIDVSEFNSAPSATDCW